MEYQQWLKDVIGKIEKKMELISERIEGKMPFISINGKYDDRSESAIYSWTNGFIGGIFWLTYILTGIEKYKMIAEKTEKQLDGAFSYYEKLDHDVGFLWMPTSGIHYAIDHNHDSCRRLMQAVDCLAGRFNLNGKFIRAWDGCWYEPKGSYSIIDTMMNISLLYWASEEKGDPRYKLIAQAHADTTIREHIRGDGSVAHIAVHDFETGEYVKTIGGQGYNDYSAWSRGQAWAIYGFVISYIHTKEERYLNTAKIVSNYFILSVIDDYLPRCDFRSPEEPIYYDASAGAIAACGLLELAKYCNEFDAKKYKRVALKILEEMEKNFCDWTDQQEAILTHSSRKYADSPDPAKGHNIPLIFGDYFFLEAIAKLHDHRFMIW